MKIRLLNILLLITSLGMTSSFAAQRVFDKEQLAEYKSMEKYDYDKEMVIEPGPFMKALEPIFEALTSIFQVIGAFFSALTSGFGLVILLLIFLGLVGLIVYFINRSGYGSGIDDKEIDDTVFEEVEDINQLDLSELLKQALKNKDFRTALRVKFLQVIQGLDDKNYIEWKNEKTNYDYYNEITDQSIRDKFDKVSYLYEYTWYGEVELDELRYLQLEPSFSNMIKQLGS